MINYVVVPFWRGLGVAAILGLVHIVMFSIYAEEHKLDSSIVGYEVSGAVPNKYRDYLQNWALVCSERHSLLPFREETSVSCELVEEVKE